MSLASTLGAFDAWRWAGQCLVLVTVIETEGSTYTKPGHRMVVADDGHYHGMVSGGCLEGDLAEHAREVMADGESRLVTYDLRDEADEVFGLGIGCNGLLRLLLQRLEPGTHYAPYLDIAACHRSFAGGRLALVTHSDMNNIQAGATRLQTQEGTTSWGLPENLSAPIDALLAQQAPTKHEALTVAGQRCELLMSRVLPIPRLLILGAGPDAAPLVRMAAELGWRVSVADHRPAYLANPGLKTAYASTEARPGALRDQLNPDEFHAAVIMTHHLDSDRAHLAELAESGLTYIGLLGPRARRDRLLTELGPAGESLGRRLHGPVGLDLPVDSPESIALSIIAEIQQHIATLLPGLDCA